MKTPVLFELISHRYELKSLLITYNQTFSDRGSIFGDTTMTGAAIRCEACLWHRLVPERYYYRNCATQFP